MSIVFDQVSFTYDNPERAEKQRRRTKRRREKAKAQSGATAKPSEKPAWGTSPDAVWALRDISFTLEDGEFFGIAGHTGSGKSTLLQHMNGLVRPTCGTVSVGGRDLANKKAAQAVRGQVGMVFQYPEHQLFAATVYDDVAFGPRNLGLAPEEVDERVQRALRDVQLDFEALREKSPFELSGGQQRRVAFAGVLAMNPRILVLDEPVAGLDPHAREEFLQLIANLHEGGLTVVMVSHSMDDLARYCDRILVLKEGEQFALGTPAEVFADAERLRSIGLGVPTAQKLANDLRENGFSLPRALYDAEALADDLAALYHARKNGSKTANGKNAASPPEASGSPGTRGASGSPGAPGAQESSEASHAR